IWCVVGTVWWATWVADAHVCWQALLRCQQERDCELAYNQYMRACDPFLKGARKQCPSHCIGALVRLNQTLNGPDLESCDCGQDTQCRRTKSAIEPCMPRRYRTDPAVPADLGCTEARQRCEDEAACQGMLTSYLANCGQLFNGRRCTAKCQDTIEHMLSTPSGALLNKCICDGVERPFCEVMKDNMERLCFGGPGLSTLSPEPEDAPEEEDDADPAPGRPDRERSAATAAAAAASG
uniref:GDNF/GAS1 domain-containing protein n=2 Tax=Latimeria chalumnae TaxID=7897 RepID=H3A7W6_LATCH